MYSIGPSICARNLCICLFYAISYFISALSAIVLGRIDSALWCACLVSKRIRNTLCDDRNFKPCRLVFSFLVLV